MSDRVRMYTLNEQRGHTMQGTKIHKVTPEQAGLWLDGTFRNRIDADVIQLAVEMGMPDLPREDRAIVNCWRKSGYRGDLVMEMADDAIDWLNEHVSPEGYSFCMSQGDFALMRDDT